MRKKIKIQKAANYLGRSVETLRRWDKEKRLIAHRKKNNYRYYFLNELEEFSKKISLLSIAKQWVKEEKCFKPLPCYYCQDSFIFKTRLAKLQNRLEKNFPLEISSIISSIVGEIGNNSFDHNIGNWPDIIGVFFGYNLKNQTIVLADRGQGILKTLKRIKPNLKSHKKALKVAFTEIISGRHPEHRGNGLKFVKKSVEENKRISLLFQTGNAKIKIKDKKEINIKNSKEQINGCLAKISF